MGSYMLGTEIFNPDLDTNSKPSHRLWILSYPIRMLSHHRGLLHNIFIGWLIIEIYLLIIGIILSVIANKLGIGYDLNWMYNNVDKLYDKIFAFSLGLFLSNTIHIVADYLANKVNYIKNRMVDTV